MVWTGESDPGWSWLFSASLTVQLLLLRAAQDPRVENTYSLFFHLTPSSFCSLNWTLWKCLSTAGRNTSPFNYFPYLLLLSGAYRVFLRANSWFCAQESFLAVLWEPYVELEIEPGLIACIRSTLAPVLSHQSLFSFLQQHKKQNNILVPKSNPPSTIQIVFQFNYLPSLV